MTNVLIPTDFTAESLDTIATAAMNMPEKLNIILFHIFEMPDSLADVMRLNRSGYHNDLITEELRVKCRQVKAEHANLASIRFQLIFGTTVAVFKNFAEAQGIDVIVYPDNYKFIPVVKESVDPHRMFMKSGVSVIRNFSNEIVLQRTLTPNRNHRFELQAK